MSRDRSFSLHLVRTDNVVFMHCTTTSSGLTLLGCNLVWTEFPVIGAVSSLLGLLLATVGQVRPVVAGGSLTLWWWHHYGALT